MQISRIELSLLRLSDGIASAADEERLRQSFTEAELRSWKQVSRLTSACLQPAREENIDVSEAVMERIQQSAAEMDASASMTSLPSGLLKTALKDGASPNLTDSIMDLLQSSEPRQGKSESVIVPDKSTNVSIVSSAEDPWSHSEDLQSMLLYGSGDASLVADAVMEHLQLEEAVLHTAVLEELSSHSVDTSDADVPLEEASLNPDSLPSNSAMSFEHEIPEPIIATSALDIEPESSYENEHLMVVEFTEEEEFVLSNETTVSMHFEEDSDEELCSVDEGFVTESMLEHQELSWISLESTLLDGADNTVDIWSSIVHEVTQPPLRLLRDDPEIEVVDKIPMVEGVNRKSADNVDQKVDAGANVEFLNSKSIDADSTISKVSITILGSFLAVAAAWIIIVLPSLLTQTTSTINTPKRIVTFEVAEVNQLEVEDLEVGEDMNVQILQGDANSPTIIFLDEMEAL